MNTPIDKVSPKIKVWQGIDIEYADKFDELSSKGFRDKANKYFKWQDQWIDPYKRDIIAMVTGTYYPKTHLKGTIDSLIRTWKTFRENGNEVFAEILTAFKDGCMYANSTYLDRWNRNNPVTRRWTDEFERNIIKKWKSDPNFHRGALICMKYLEGMFDE